MSTKRQHGLTIIELVMFMVIMGVAAAGIIGVINLSTASSADPLRRKQAMLIAEAFMEEVQLAPFTLCVPTDPNVNDATTPCVNFATVGSRAANAVRPYGTVTDYATELDKEQRTFAVDGVDRDVNGRALGQDQNLNTIGNSSLAPITTTVTLSLVGNGDTLGPAAGPGNLRLGSAADAANLNVLRITVITRYGGPSDVIRLDGFRTRYAPQN